LLYGKMVLMKTLFCARPPRPIPPLPTRARADTPPAATRRPARRRPNGGLARRLLASLLCLLGGATLPATAEPLLVAAASDLAGCIEELGAAFRRQAPEAELKVTTGASGNLFAQIKNGAPYDVFLSADLDYPSRLARDGAADPASLTPYARGRLALWSLDARFDLRLGWRVLADARLTRIAIANPAIAPYGRAAKAGLEQQRLWQTVEPKLVLGENIAQTAQFIQTGNAELGIVSLATVRSPRLKGVGSYALLPETGGAPITQGAVVTRHGQSNALAARFVRFLGSPAAREVLERNGFEAPPEPSAPP
jgi:molybdate transport system substrate-binding protein